MNKLIAQSYINGKWISSERGTILVKSPYSGEVIGERLLATPVDVEGALASAFSAKKDIARMPAYERARTLKTAAAVVEKDKVRLSRLMAQELGKPLKYC